MRNELDPLSTKPLIVFIHYLIPAVTGLLIVAIGVILDTLICGYGIGSEGIAAVNINKVVLGLMYSLGYLFGSGGATIFSINIGKKDTRAAREVFTRTIQFCIITSFILIVGAFILENEIIWMIGATPETFVHVVGYFSGLIIFAPVFITEVAMIIYSINDGNPRIAVISTGVNVAVNSLLNFILVVLLHWGTFGAAFATGFGTTLSLIIKIVSAVKRKESNLRLVKIKEANIGMFFRTIKIGASPFFMEYSPGIIAMVFNIVISKKLGDVGLGAYGIISSLLLFAYCIFSGIAQAIQPIISVNFGANNMKRVAIFKRYGLVVAIGFGILFFAVGVIFKSSLAGLFISNEPVVTKMVSDILLINFSVCLPMGVNIVIATYFQSLEMGLKAFIIMFLRGFALPVGCVLIMQNFGEIGIWASQSVAELMTFVTVIILIITAYKDIKESAGNAFFTNKAY